jgi:hypothetical protein
LRVDIPAAWRAAPAPAGVLGASAGFSLTKSEDEMNAMTLQELENFIGELDLENIEQWSNESDDPNYLERLAFEAGYVAFRADEWIRDGCPLPLIPDENAVLLQMMLYAQRAERLDDTLRRAADMFRTGLMLPSVPRLQSQPGQRYLFHV